jgi:hypothetical protein
MCVETCRHPSPELSPPEDRSRPTQQMDARPHMGWLPTPLRVPFVDALGCWEVCLELGGHGVLMDPLSWGDEEPRVTFVGMLLLLCKHPWKALLPKATAKRFSPPQSPASRSRCPR